MRICVLLICGLLITTRVQADLDTLIGRNGRVNVGEYAGTATPGVDLSFFPDVLNGSDEVFGFAVSNNQPLGGLIPDTWTTRTEWLTATVSPTQWNAGFNAAGTITSDLGTFSEFFGSDARAFLYYSAMGDGGFTPFSEADDWDAPFVNNLGDPLHPFVFNVEFLPVTTTEFVAWGSGGAFIDASITAVPEPSSALMLSLIGIGFVGYRRRRQVS